MQTFNFELRGHTMSATRHNTKGTPGIRLDLLIFTGFDDQLMIIRSVKCMK